MARRDKVVEFPAPRAIVSPPAPPALRLLSPLSLFFILLACLTALHAPLLRLPYFWDEAGYYVPAARDLLLRGDLIPQFSNAHPPLVMAWLAAWWKVFSFTPAVTRIAMLVVAAFTLTGVYRLARIAAGGGEATQREVALASVVCTGLFPVFFAQSTLAQVDLAAAGFTVWALSFYIEGRRALAIVLLAAAGLAKETAILAPLALFTWEIVGQIGKKHFNAEDAEGRKGGVPLRAFASSALKASSLLASLVPLALWYAYHYHRTGYVFGNPEYVRYNIATTLHPARIAAAALTRLWHLLGYMNMFVLTLAAAMAMRLPPQLEFTRGGNGRGGVERPRIIVPIQAAFYAVIAAYVLALSVVGGAALARYLLPVYPLVIILCVATLRRRLPWWKAFVGVVCVAFVIALLTDPPYRFAPEDNLDYAGYVRLHQAAEKILQTTYGTRTVLTAWPASDELAKPFLGYVQRPLRVLAVDDFTAEQMMLARQEAGRYDVVFAFSTKYEPRLLLQLPFWERLQERYFGYHRDLPPEAIAQLLGGRLVYVRHDGGQWVAIITIEHAEEAVFRNQDSRRAQERFNIREGEYIHLQC